MDTLKGIQGTEAWINYKSQGADAMTLDEVRAIAKYKVFDNGKLDVNDLTMKCVTNVLIHQGYHMKDVHRLKEDDVVHFKDHKDRTGYHRSYYQYMITTHANNHNSSTHDNTIASVP